MKKQWKKISIILLGVSMLASISGCVASERDENKQQEYSPEESDIVLMDSEEIEKMEAQEELQSYLEAEGVQKIIERGYLIVGCREYAPGMSVYNEEKAQYEGFEIDLAYHLAAYIFGVPYESAVSSQLVHFEPLTDATWKSMIAADQIDYAMGIMGSYVNTREYVVSAPYYKECLNVLSKKSIGALEGIENTKIGVLKGADVAKTLSAYATSGLLGISPQLVEFETILQAKAALENDEIQGICSSQALLQGILEEEFVVSMNAVGERNLVVASKMGSGGLGILSNFIVNELAHHGVTESLVTKWEL